MSSGFLKMASGTEEKEEAAVEVSEAVATAISKGRLPVATCLLGTFLYAERYTCVGTIM